MRKIRNGSGKKKQLQTKYTLLLLTVLCVLTIFFGLLLNISGGPLKAIAGFIFWKIYGPTKESADLNTYYGIENEDQLAIIVNNEVLGAQGMISDGKAYVEYSIVRDYINERFYWDPHENIMLYTLPNDVVTVGVGNKDYTISKEKNSADYVILKTEGNTAYIALDFIQQYTNMEYEVYDDPNRVMISTEVGEVTVAKLKKDAVVRYQGGLKSPVLTEVSKKDEVTIIESEGEDWKKVRTKDGFIGYVRNSNLKSEQTKTIVRDFTEPVFTNISKDYTINMAWHNVTNEVANGSVLEMIARTKGLTTMVPCCRYKRKLILYCKF